MTRLERLTAMLIQLQTKRVVRAQELADRFGISLRTVYRDVRALEEAGVPIGAEAGIGYFLEGYHLPPVSFTNEEATALLFGEKLIERWVDDSIRSAFESALYKIKSVLKPAEQDHLNDLAPHVDVQRAWQPIQYAGVLLNDIQQAVAAQQVVSIDYRSPADVSSERLIEPIGLLQYGAGWHLIAYCRTRQDYRDFRVDRIQQLTRTPERFNRRNRLSLQEYLDHIDQSPESVEVVLIFRRDVARFLGDQRSMWGFYAEEELGDQVRMHFRTIHLEGMSRWLLAYTGGVTVEHPDQLRLRMQELAGKVQQHWG